MGSGLARIAAKDAISAIVAAEVGQRNEDFAGIGDDVRLETLFGIEGRGKQSPEIAVRATDELDGVLP
jgi:hypothetical protein